MLSERKTTKIRSAESTLSTSKGTTTIVAGVSRIALSELGTIDPELHDILPTYVQG